MNFQNLFPSLSIGKFDLNVNFKSSRSDDSLIKKILSVSHSNDNNVVQGLHSFNVSEELIDDLITNLTSYSSMHASLLANGVNFIKNYDV